MQNKVEKIETRMSFVLCYYLRVHLVLTCNNWIWMISEFDIINLSNQSLWFLYEVAKHRINFRYSLVVFGVRYTEIEVI